MWLHLEKMRGWGSTSSDVYVMCVCFGRDEGVLGKMRLEGLLFWIYNVKTKKRSLGLEGVGVF